MDLPVFKASLIYIVSTDGQGYKEEPCLKNKNENKRQNIISMMLYAVSMSISQIE